MMVILILGKRCQPRVPEFPIPFRPPEHPNKTTFLKTSICVLRGYWKTWGRVIPQLYVLGNTSGDGIKARV